MTTTDRPTMPPIACQPWCRYGDGHPDTYHAEDQECWSDELSSEFICVYPADMSKDDSAVLDVSAAHRPTDHTAPFVVLTVNEKLPEYHMTPMQARVLAAHLTLVADQLDKARAMSALAAVPAPQTVADVVAVAAEAGVRASDVMAAMERA
jgi:hypothetical protein